MADISIPFHGVHWIKHVLEVCPRMCPRTSTRTRPRISSRTRTRMRTFPALILICALLSGCTDNEPSATASASGPIPLDWQSFLNTDESGQDPLLPISFPADLAPHSDASAESFTIRALVFDQQQRMSSVFVQLDRIRLRADATSESKWSYSSVFRAQAAVASDGDA